MSGGPFLYPNVTSLPGQAGGVGASERERPKKNDPAAGEFDRVFDQVMTKTGGKPDLSQAREALKFSAHATQRLQDRKIAIDPGLMSKISEAVDKAAAKGVEDTLVLTDNAALIVNVKNKTVITAMDKNSLNGNVFTNIDGAVIV